MEVKLGKGTTGYGTGVEINLTGEELAIAIDSYLVSHGVTVRGARTVTVNGELCGNAEIYVDPSGFAIFDGKKYSGRGVIED